MNTTCFKKVPLGRPVKLLACGLVFALSSHGFAQSNPPVVQLIKGNATGFAMDGNRGGDDGQDVYLYNEDEDNVNQQWYEIDRGNGHYSYQKVGTDFCIDGGRGGVIRQNVYLWTCSANNQNQHWLKVSVGDYSRLEKRNAPGVSIDGRSGGENLQSVYLRESNSGSENQQWQVNYISDPVRGGGSGDISVESLDGLQDALRDSNQTITLRSGTYNITELPRNERTLEVSGSNNVINLSGVTIEFPVNQIGNEEYHINFTGRGNTLNGGTLENTYPSGVERITDYVSYNQDRDGLANGGAAHILVDGEGTTINDTKLIIRGSFPYGYGSIFGIGSGNTFALSKRSGIQVWAPNATLDGVELQMESFGHGIFMQRDADNTTIRNSLVEGRVRETNDMLAEGRGSLPDLADYMTVDGDPIPPNEVNSLSEDGIRSYNRTGSVTVENTTVRRMRGGIRLYLAGGATVRNSAALDSGSTNFNMPRNGVVENATGNFTNGVLHDFRSSRDGQDLEITILPSPNAIGNHNIADILGNGHDIVFRRANGPEDTGERRVIKVYGNNSTIRNETEYTIELEPGTSGNTIISAGDVRDDGSNSVRSIDLDL